MSPSRSMPRAAAFLLAAPRLMAPILPGTVFAAPVGVTSASDGDPLGKPPNASERVLHVGVDVQASELVTTGSNDRAQLLFLDGTSLTVGPNAEMRLDRFVFDPASGTGELGVSLGKGVLRMVGGKISKTRPVIVTTPGGTVGIRGGIAIVSVQQGQASSTFMFGRDMTVTGQGVTQTVTRPGFEIVQRFGAQPLPPQPVSDRTLKMQVQQLEGRQSASGAAQQGGPATVKVSQGVQNVAAQQPSPQPAPTAGAQQPAGWQQWGGGVAYQNPSAVNPAISGGTTPQSVSTTLVAGQMPSFSQLPTTGTATYTGTFATNWSSNGPFGGAISMNWNFANQNGTFSATANGQSGVTGSGSGPVSLVDGTAKFSGTATGGNVTNINSVAVNGNFVTSTTSAVGGITGTFTGRSGNAVMATGTFSGSK